MGFWDLLKTFLIMIAVVFGAFYAAKFIAGRGAANRKNDKIRLLAAQRLGKDSSVVIVEIERCAYILGVGSQQVRLIDKLPLDQAPGLAGDEGAAVRPDVAAILKKEFGDRFKRPR